ncbi:hypothetical protein CYMTET_30565, partial [Cymbomonas tetramitiformis]
VMLPHDYINYRLTGKYCMECGDASGTGLLDISKRAFDEERCEDVDASLYSMLPPLVSSDAPIGTLLPAIAEELNLPAGIPVSPGGGDNMMSALGAGAVRSGPLIISLGTSATLFGYCEHAVEDASGVVAPFCDSTGGWMPLVCIQNCTSATEEMRSAFDLSHERISELAAEVPAGADGVTFLPYLTGARTPNWPHASGALVGLRPQSMQPGVLYRAAMEGVANSLLLGFRRMQELGMEANELRVVGGGSKNDVWCQIIADVFQMPVKKLIEAETAALGAAMQAAAISAGRPVAPYISAHPPSLADQILQFEPEHAAPYSVAFKQHVELGKKLFG